MAGHNKWSKIKRQKKRKDRQKSRIFGKLSREIAVAAREGGGDPEYNPRLRTAVENAEAEEMPKDTIERAIKRGTGELEGVDYQEHSYEGYGPGGVALYLECLTDNENRTVQEVRHILESHGGNLGRDGSVAWMFRRSGRVRVDAERYDEDAVFEAALMAGAESMTSDGDAYVITTSTEDFHRVQDRIREQGVKFEDARLAMVPESTVRVDGGEAEDALDLLEALEDHEDVQHVYSNLEVDGAELSSVDAS